MAGTIGSVAPAGAGIAGIAGVAGVMPAGGGGVIVGRSAGRAGGGVMPAGVAGGTGVIVSAGGGLLGKGGGADVGMPALEPAAPIAPLTIPLPAVPARDDAAPPPKFVPDGRTLLEGPATSSAPHAHIHTNVIAKTNDRTSDIATSAEFQSVG